MRQALLENKDLREELGDLKQILEERFRIVFETLDQLLAAEYKKKIGFTVKEKQAIYGKKNKSVDPEKLCTNGKGTKGGY